MNSGNKIVIITATIILLVGGIALWHFKTNQTNNSSGFTEAPKGGDFTLQSASGPFSLKAQRGKVVLLYFGYTHCPDVCPTTLTGIAQAFKALKKNELAQVEAVFVSVDPERDSPKKLAAYTKFFSPSIIGVTGTPRQIARVAKQFGAVYRKVKNPSGKGYLISHSANTYVIAPDGTLNTIFPDATPPRKIDQVIRSLLTQGQNK
ncbi:MAG: SCO family protein [Gammaproteobacteria bacterium]|jgi:protein SCO1